MSDQNPSSSISPGRLAEMSKRLFVKLGILPFLLVIAIIVFASMSENFLTGRNLMNVLRQSVYLMIVSMGQMLALLTGGFDLSVGTILALTSVVGALVMAWNVYQTAQGRIRDERPYETTPAAPQPAPAE